MTKLVRFNTDGGRTLYSNLSLGDFERSLIRGFGVITGTDSPGYGRVFHVPSTRVTEWTEV